MSWLNKIINKITAVRSDKWVHIIASMILAQIFFKVCGYDSILAAFTAFWITMLFGIVKEFYDELFRYGFDRNEILLDALGATIGIIIMLL